MVKLKTGIAPASMVAVGNKGNLLFEKCADNWTDSELALLRSKLPEEHQNVPLDFLKIDWISLRKADRLEKLRTLKKLRRLLGDGELKFREGLKNWAKKKKG